MFWNCNTALVDSNKVPISKPSWKLFEIIPTKEKAEKKKRESLGGTVKYWVTPATDMDQNQRGDSYWVTSKPEHRADPVWRLTEGEFIFILQLCLRFSAPFSVCVFSSSENSCVFMFVCVSWQIIVSMWIYINKRFRCWLCLLLASCFWSSLDLVLSASFESTGQIG